MTVRYWIAAGLLIAVGTAQMIGDLIDVLPLKAVAAATGASPAPKVFTAHKGFETYSSAFFIFWHDVNGARQSVQLTPEIYRNVRGPYNRRNAYGAALSYAPVLYANATTKPMLESVLNYTFCGGSTILDELGISDADGGRPFGVELKPRQALPAGHGWKLRFEIRCDAQ